MLTRLLPYDIYERHRKIGSLIKSNQTVVDIGGELNHLVQFCHPKKLIVANLDQGDIIISKDKLPFKNNSFDVACAIDVLEHIPKKNRKIFINNLMRISRDQIILSFPVGTIKHKEYEIKTQEWLLKKKVNVEYLEEHIRHGLPDVNEIQKLTNGLISQTNYSGNTIINNILFKLYMFDPKIKFIRRAVYIIKNIFYLLSNNILYIMLSNKKYSPSIIRAYIVIKINK